MLSQVSSPTDVVAFAKLLIKEGNIFHPENDFNDYINIETQQRTYSKDQADRINRLMNQCFSVCNENEIALLIILVRRLNAFLVYPFSHELEFFFIFISGDNCCLVTIYPFVGRLDRLREITLV